MLIVENVQAVKKTNMRNLSVLFKQPLHNVKCFSMTHIYIRQGSVTRIDPKLLIYKRNTL